MKKIKVARVVEIVGILGVVFSLVFVGLEIRQNTKVAKAEAYRSFMTEMNESYAALTDSSYAAFQVRVAPMRKSELTDVEFFQVFGSFMVLMRTYEGLHKQVTSGVLDRSALLLMSQSNWDTPIWRDVWPNVSRNLTPDFVSYFEATHGYDEPIVADQQ